MRACACTRAREIIEEFGPVPLPLAARPTESSLTLRRYAAGHADGTAGPVELSSDGLMKLSAQY